MKHTIVYYTANLISDFFAENVRRHIASFGLPIVSVSHKPIDFGKNICIEGMPISNYTVYQQILLGAREVDTKYIICCEDDTLYNAQHFNYEPSKDTFAYNVNRWNCNPFFYYYRHRSGMCMCIAPTELMIDTLEKRFKKYPKPIERRKFRGFGEPGRYEHDLGLPPVKMETFRTKHPTVTFNHRPSLGGKRRLLKTDIIEQSIPLWGKAYDTWTRFYGDVR